MELAAADRERVELDLFAVGERQREVLAFVDLPQMRPGEHVVELHPQSALFEPR